MGKNTKVITHTISIIRDRGQLTIPDSIRALREWTSPNSVVTITNDLPDEIVIRPHKKEFDWNKIWDGIRISRSLKGKGKTTSTVQFLENDRRSH